jgi:hypothetical protein
MTLLYIRARIRKYLILSTIDMPKGESRRTGIRKYRNFCSLFGKVWYKELIFEILVATRRFTLRRPLLRRTQSGEQLHPPLHCPHHLMCLFFRFALSKIMQGLVSKRSAGYDATVCTCSHPKVLTLEHHRHAKRSESRRTGIRKYTKFFMVALTCFWKL